jgi:hypothetical protein
LHCQKTLKAPIDTQRLSAAVSKPGGAPHDLRRAALGQAPASPARDPAGAAPCRGGLWGKGLTSFGRAILDRTPRQGRGR